MIISHSRGRGKKVHIFLDDEYRITTDIDFWSEHYIKDGSNIDDEEWDALLDAINYKKAVNKCYDLLSRRDHSVKELRVKLLRTIDETSAEKAIDKMIELGYLNDEKYALALLDHLVNNKDMSKAFIKQEFYKRGIPADITDNILSNYEFDNVSAVFDLLNTKYRSKLRSDDGYEKVVNALIRKGFSYSDVKAAFERMENIETNEQ